MAKLSDLALVRSSIMGDVASPSVYPGDADGCTSNLKRRSCLRAMEI
jgi:hypothetical protein